MGNLCLLCIYDGHQLFLGSKVFPVPYAWKKLFAYIGIVIILYFIEMGIVSLIDNIYFDLALSVFFTSAFVFS